VANVSYLRAPGTQRAWRKSRGGVNDAPRGRRPLRYIIAGLMLLAVAGVVVAGVALTSAKASLSADSVAIAKVGLPLGGGTIQSLSVVTGPHSQPLPGSHRTRQDHPLTSSSRPTSAQIQVGQAPGLDQPLAGAKQKLTLTLMIPRVCARTTSRSAGGRRPARAARRRISA
jgi:hypothetical protein